MKSLSGFMLLEILISLLLASVILTLLTRHFFHVKQVYRHHQSALEEANERAFIANLMRNKIQMAGFTPCGNVSNLNTSADNSLQPPLKGLVIKPNSLQINRMSEPIGLVNRLLTRHLLEVSGAFKIKSGDRVMVSDCLHAELHQVDYTVHRQNQQLIGLQQALHYEYQLPAYIAPWVSERFYTKPNQTNRASLFYKAQHADELSANVDAIEVQVEGVLVRVRLLFNQITQLELFTALRTT